MSLMRDRTFTATGLAHFSIDVLNSQVGILLAFLSSPLALSNAMIGLVATLYSLSGSLSQPVFGWLSDRGNPKPYAVGGVIWMALFFSLAILLPGRVALLFLVIAAFGSAAFHPSGAAEATRRGQDHRNQLETTAASLFFFFGQGGLFLGPLLGGPLLDLWGRRGLFFLFIVILPSALLLHRVWHPLQTEMPGSRSESRMIQLRGMIVPSLLAFVLLIFLRSWAQMSVIAFLPKYLSDLGLRPMIFGPITALFMGGAAIGGVLGGWLADRYGNRIVAFWSLILAIIPMLGLAFTQLPALLAALTFLAGLFVGAPHSILIVLAQRMLPGQRGAASGLVLGFTFASGALGNLASGVLADSWGFQNLFILLAFFIGVASLMALTLKPPMTKQVAGI